jgi:hypothetical protein
MTEEPKIPGGSINEPDAVRTMPPHYSINEPAPVAPPPVELPPLALTSIDPDVIPVQPVEITSTQLALTGTGFTVDCVVLFDDEEVLTQLDSPTRMLADVPLSATPGVFDVEVHRGEDMSDVLVFEIVAVASDTRKAPQRKPPKGKPAKRTRAKGHY